MTKPQEKKYTWALKLFISIYFISTLFKITHWPYLFELELLSTIVLLIFYPLRYRAKEEKFLLDHVKMAWVLVHCIIVLGSLQDVIALEILETLFFIYWFVSEGFFYFDINLAFWKEKDVDASLLDVQQVEPKFSNITYLVDYLLLLSVFLMYFVGYLFKLMHWPFATEALICGTSLFVITIWFKKF